MKFIKSIIFKKKKILDEGVIQKKEYIRQKNLQLLMKIAIFLVCFLYFNSWFIRAGEIMSKGNIEEGAIYQAIDIDNDGDVDFVPISSNDRVYIRDRGLFLPYSMNDLPHRTLFPGWPLDVLERPKEYQDVERIDEQTWKILKDLADSESQTINEYIVHMLDFSVILD